MATAPQLSDAFVSVQEYLHTVYRPDVEYVDGVLEERNVGEMDHSSVQRAIFLALLAFEEEDGLYAIQETRTQTQATRFRVPDVALLKVQHSTEQIIRTAPLLCVEVMSPEDRLSRLRQRCEDFLRMGVLAVWIFDTAQQTAYVMTAEDFVEVSTGSLHLQGTSVTVNVPSIFASAQKRAKPRNE